MTRPNNNLSHRTQAVIAIATLAAAALVGIGQALKPPTLPVQLNITTTNIDLGTFDAASSEPR